MGLSPVMSEIVASQQEREIGGTEQPGNHHGAARKRS